VTFSISGKSLIHLLCLKKPFLSPIVNDLHFPQVPCSGNDGAAVAERKPVCLFGIINLAKGKNMTGTSVFIKYNVSLL
jgi:hypothetical protein